jgi:DNA-binding transcriptional regulator YiaG
MTAKQVRDARKSLDLTQDQFAALIGVSRNTIARWEMDDASDHARRVSTPMARLIERVVQEQQQARQRRKEERKRPT